MARRSPSLARPDTGPVTPGDHSAEDARRLWAVSSDGTNAHPLVIDGADCRQELPQWSRDGKRLLFVCLGPERHVRP